MTDRTSTAIIGSLLTVVGALALLWVMIAPENVTRGEMQDYIQVTAVEHLRYLREDLKEVTEALGEVTQRLAGVEAVLRERMPP